MSENFSGDLTRSQNALLYVLGTLDMMKSKGFVEGGFHQMTDEGRAAYRKLVESGFEPTDEEIIETMLVIQVRPE